MISFLLEVLYLNLWIYNWKFTRWTFTEKGHHSYDFEFCTNKVLRRINGSAYMTNLGHLVSFWTWVGPWREVNITILLLNITVLISWGLSLIDFFPLFFSYFFLRTYVLSLASLLCKPPKWNNKWAYTAKGL